MTPFVRRLAVALATGALSVSAAWAGAALAPVGGLADVADVSEAAGELSDVDERLAPSEVSATTRGQQESIDSSVALEPGSVTLPTTPLNDGWYYAGAAKVSLEPAPEAYDGTWEQDPEKCNTLSENFFTQLPDSATHVASAGSPWPENPNCIYMGGYGIGPMNAIVDWDDEYGLWARTFALSDGEDPLFLTVIDAEGWFWDYASKCDDCGWKQIGDRLAEELGTERSAFIFHSTHAHTAMDFIGGWGFVPDWYMQQATDAIEESVRRAVASMQRARLEVGEVEARHFNRERRDSYHAAEEQQLTWLRAYVPGATQTPQREVIATLGTYAAHPTTIGTNDGVGHGDWPVVFESRLEERFDGIGFHFMTGLGNMSATNPAHTRGEGEGSLDMGRHLADLIPAVGEGRLVETTQIETAQEVWDQPTTNVPLTALGAPGFFDRQFQPEPATINVGPNSQAPCVSASPVSVEVAANAARIGTDLYVTSGPGELFSNLTNVIKEKTSENYGGAFAMPIAQANDALGYILQSFEAGNPASGQGAGFGTSGPLWIEYEDAYAIDRCFGDKVLETILGSLLPAVGG